MSKKIAGIIVFQILLIVTSYLVLVFFENQSTYLGNTINISGKNRFFGEQLYQKTIRYALTNEQNQSTDTIQNIDDNMELLSHGGVISEQGSVAPKNEIVIMAIPSKFSDDVSNLSNSWDLYKAAVISKTQSTKDKNILTDQDFGNYRTDFVVSANQITDDLSNYSKELIVDMTILQITLLVINVTAHVLLLRIILRLIREDQTKKILLQQISDKNKELEFESKLSLLQKDISQSFIADMEDKLHELNEQVRLMREGKDYDKNNLIVSKIFQNIFFKIQQLAKSTLELENKASDYEQLIQKMCNNVFSSKNDNKLTNMKNPEDSVKIIQSYIDIVNLMIYKQDIPVKLGKNLNDAFYDIVDHLTPKTVKP